jgi:hypothetical protein
MQQHTREASDGRRYTAGDAVKFRIVLDHKLHLKEIRLAFVHEADKRAVIMVKGEPHLRSERTTGGSRRSSLDAEVTIPCGRPSGVYRLDRIGYETAGGGRGRFRGRLTRTATGTSEYLTKPNFVERRKAEVQLRRIILPRTPVNGSGARLSVAMRVRRLTVQQNQE